MTQKIFSSFILVATTLLFSQNLNAQRIQAKAT